MPAATPYVDRLDWALPDFTRIAWAGDRARVVWEPRLQRLSALMTEIEWRSVETGLRACAVATLADDEMQAASERCAAGGLAMRRLMRHARCGHYSNAAQPARPGAPVVNRVVIGRPAEAERFTAAAAAGDDNAQGALLGYPDCCRRFFDDYWVGHNCADTTWPMACASVAAASAREIDVAPDHPAANLLWRFVGARAVPHLPCCFTCAASVRFADRLRRTVDAEEEALAWLDEILAWPVEWSGLHGIAEIKTPILKIVTRTDATAGKYVVRWRGARYPQEGASGLGFPYRSPRKPLIASSAAYARGLANPLAEPPPV